jgi:D-lactate dehydrogenase
MDRNALTDALIEHLQGRRELGAIARDFGLPQAAVERMAAAIRREISARIDSLTADSEQLNVAVVSAREHDETSLRAALEPDSAIELSFFSPSLALETVDMIRGFDVVCAFVNDRLDAPVLEALAERGVRAICLRCAGFNQVDLEAAERLGITVTRVPGYSPEAVAEHTIALILALDRQLTRAWRRVTEGNFMLRGLMGFNLSAATVGIIGTGRIGTALARALSGFGCELLAHDPQPSRGCLDLGVEYVALPELLARSRIISLHCPLSEATRHIIDREAIGRMQPGVMLINTGRGALIDTRAVIDGLKSGRIGYLGLDVYEQEENLFFRDLSDEIITDDVFQRLMTFPNVLITGHQGFFTREAIDEIAATVMGNLTALAQGKEPPDILRV